MICGTVVNHMLAQLQIEYWNQSMVRYQFVTHVGVPYIMRVFENPAFRTVQCKEREIVNKEKKNMSCPNGPCVCHCVICQVGRCVSNVELYQFRHIVQYNHIQHSLHISCVISACVSTA